jgi:hypothetical protein
MMRAWRLRPTAAVVQPSRPEASANQAKTWYMTPRSVVLAEGVEDEAARTLPSAT